MAQMSHLTFLVKATLQEHGTSAHSNPCRTLLLGVWFAARNIEADRTFVDPTLLRFVDASGSFKAVKACSKLQNSP